MSVMSLMRTVSDIFDAFGGNAAIGRVLGVNPSTASEMKRRESIPVEYWPMLVEAAKQNEKPEINFESLAIIMAEAGTRRRNERAGQGAAA